MTESSSFGGLPGSVSLQSEPQVVEVRRWIPM